MYRHAQRDNGQPGMAFGFIHSLLFIAWHFETAPFTRKGEGNSLVHVCLMVLKLASMEKKKERKKKDDDF